MKLTVLADNNTLIDHYYCGEPAVCYHIEDEGTQLLLDTGYSDIFMKNAVLAGIDLSAVSVITFSHGHNDHTRGLGYFLKEKSAKNLNIIAHPDTFKERVSENLSIGSPLPEEEIRKQCKLILTRTPLQISRHLTFLGEIPSSNDFENRRGFGYLKDDSGLHEDKVMDDTALAYNSGQGLFIITGCSHSGICNIIEYAKNICNEERIIGVIGGFHLFDISTQLMKTIDYFRENKIKDLYPCHCVSFAAKAEIHKYTPIHEVGVGMTLEI